MARLFIFLGCCWGLLAAPCRGQSNNGLKGDYYNGWSFNQKVFTRTDRQIEFSWDGSTLPGPGLNPQTFSIRWTGKIYAPASGPYKFTAIVDDGIRIWVDGKLAMDEWRYQRQKLSGQSINLKAGQFYDLKIEYYNARAGGYVQLNWNLVDETGKTAKFSTDPQQKVGGQFLYSGTPKPKPTPVVPPAPTPIAQTPPKKPLVQTVPKKPLALVVAPKPKPVLQAVAAIKPDSVRQATLPTSSPVNSVTPANELARQLLFEQSDYRLLPDSHLALDQLVATMQRDTRLQLLVAGHTDAVGDAQLNKALSENRARVVRNYLVCRGVADSRITIVGHGGSQPIVPNDTETNRAKNRRVEFKLVSN